MSALQRLQRWYAAQCDEEWEHAYGVSIETLDNPGWSITIDLNGTDLEASPFAKVIEGELDENFDETGRQVGSWMICEVQSNHEEGAKRFHAACDPMSLERVLEVFLDWAGW